MRTTLYEDELQHLYYDHDEDEFFLETDTPTGGTEQKTREEAEELLEHFQVVGAVEDVFSQFE